MTKRHTSGPRPSYNYEQKLHAVRLVREQSLSITSTCKDLNISKSALSSWLKQHDAGSLGSIVQERSITLEQQRIRELEREIQAIRAGCCHLKKSLSLSHARELS